MLKNIWFLFVIELTLLLRRSQEWLYPLGFFLIVITLFPLALTPDIHFLQKYAPGFVWVAALLASLLSVENIFYTDMEDGGLEQFILSDSPLSLIVFAKLSAQWLVTELPLILLTPIIAWMFHLPSKATFTLCLSLLLGTPILTLIGSLGVALTLGLRQQGALLGLLMLPLVIPVLIFGVNIVQESQAGFTTAGPLAFLAGLMILAGLGLSWAIAGALRIGLDD